jgi:hypothetical protein
MGEPKPKTYLLKRRKLSATNQASSLVMSSNGFLDEPVPEIVFQGRSFCFTGVFDFANGDRNQCEAATAARAGFCYERPNRALNYLVVGNHVEPAWAHGSYGRKIEAVLEFKSAGAKCQIISEEHWAKALQNAPELPQAGQALVQGHSKSDQLVQLQNDLDHLRKHQQLLVETLKAELKPEEYVRLAERLRNLGMVI